MTQAAPSRLRAEPARNAPRGLLAGATVAGVLLAACGTTPTAVQGDDLTTLDTTADGAVAPDVFEDAASDGTGPDSATDGGSDTAGDVNDGGPGPGPDAGVDTGPSPDAGTDAGPGTDAGQICVPGSTFCEGNVLVLCGDDGISTGRTRCEARGAVCQEADGGAFCAEPACEPGEVRCEGDELRVCDDVGLGFTNTRCEFGCDPDLGACAPPPDLSCDLNDVTVIEPGTWLIDLCDSNDRFEHVGTDACTSQGSADNDVMLAFDVAATSRVHLNVQDADDTVAIDTLLHVRSTCDNDDTQLGCSDDVDCDASTVEAACSGGVQVRESDLELALRPGRYYAIVESFEYNNFDCGMVQVTLELR